MACNENCALNTEQAMRLCGCRDVLGSECVCTSTCMCVYYLSVYLLGKIDKGW